jgi:integrase
MEIGVHMNDVADDPDALIFASARGKPLRNSNFRKRVWRPALKEAGIADVTRNHDLRHTATSLSSKTERPCFSCSDNSAMHPF